MTARPKATTARSGLVSIDRIRQAILLIRGHKVMLDVYLALFYGAATKVLVQAVKRNLFRFPEDFMFQLAREDLAIVSVDTLARPRMRSYMREARPYDLVVFDEAHKLSAWRDADLTVRASKRYEMAEEVAALGRHLLLLTATPHMGKDDPYYFLWRLLEPELLSTPEAFNRLSRDRRAQYALRRMKEEMVRFDGEPIYPPRKSVTVEYPLSPDERELYAGTTEYCELHWNRAKLRNRGAAGLAMSVLQRRLASSIWALLRSLERREAKLSEELRLLDQGLMSTADLEARQQRLPLEDVRDTKTGDEEEAEAGLEESERNDDEVVAATDAVSPEELRAEIAEVKRLAELARRVYDAKRGSKFERLWDALKAYAETKVLIFTEHRDTLNFLVGRLEALGLTGKLATIYGGMDYKDRDRAAEFCRKRKRNRDWAGACRISAVSVPEPRPSRRRAREALVARRGVAGAAIHRADLHSSRGAGADR